MITIDLTDSGNRLKDGCISELKNKRLTKFGSVNASGKLAASFEVKHNKNGYQILAADYVEEIIYGRPPNSQRPIKFEDIVAWCKIRGIKISPKTIIKSLIKKGNTIWQTYHGAESGIFNDSIGNELPILTKEIENFTEVQITSEIFKNFYD